MVLFAAVMIGVLVYSTLNLAQYKVEVCISFNGHTQCRSASGVTEENALRAATSVACATLANGVTEVVGCERTVPVSTKWLKRPR